MANHGFNPDIYKENQRHDWNAVSSGWEKWWDVIENGANMVSERMLEMANVQPGQRILDVATGIGEPALTAARRVGEAGHVIATDQARDMLAIAKRRAQARGLNKVTFREMDGETLGTTEQDFDAVLCRWGLMFMPDVDRALIGMHGQLKPGGTMAAAIWSSPDKVPSISLAIGVARELLQLPPPPQGTPNPFCLADTAMLKQKLQGAGFKNIRIEPVIVDFAMPSAKVYVEFTRDINAPLVALLANRTSEQQEHVWEAITKAVQLHATQDGSIHIKNEAICISGTK